MEYWTSCIPYELRLLLDARKALSSIATLEDVIQKYLSNRGEQLNAQQRRFISEHLINEFAIKGAKKAVEVMLLEIPRDISTYILLNQQLMFTENNLIYPITPLAKNILITSLEQ